MAASILSFGMLTARAFWMVRRSMGFEVGSGPPALTAMVMSLAMRANCFAMRFHRANIVCFLTSKMRPMGPWCTKRSGRTREGAPRAARAPPGAGGALRRGGSGELRGEQAQAAALAVQ